MGYALINAEDITTADKVYTPMITIPVERVKVEGSQVTIYVSFGAIVHNVGDIIAVV